MSASAPPNFEILLDIPVTLSVQLGSCQLAMKQVLELTAGSVIQLDQTAESPVDLFVNDKLVARGEVVAMEDRLGIKITEVFGKKE